MRFNASELSAIETTLSAFCRNHFSAHKKRTRKLSYRIMGYEIRILERTFCTPDEPLWIVNNIGKLKYMPDTHSWLLHRMGESGMWVKVPDAEPAKNLRLLLKIAITWFWR